MNAPIVSLILMCGLGGEGGGVLTDGCGVASAAGTLRRPPRSRAWRSAPARPPTTSRSAARPMRSWAVARRCSASTRCRARSTCSRLPELLETVRQDRHGHGDGRAHHGAPSNARALTVAEKMQIGDGRTRRSSCWRRSAPACAHEPVHMEAGARGRHGDQRGAVRAIAALGRPAASIARSASKTIRRGARARGEPARLRARLGCGGTAAGQRRGG